jgi:glycosyltransferase involved in cell wall biosynthesis
LKTFDVILPVHNEEEIIENLLCELENEIGNVYYSDNKLSLVKIIIIEDGSTDNTKIILKNYCKDKQNFLLKQFEEKLGYVKDLNLAVSNSKSEYLVFCDSSGKYNFQDLRIMIKFIDEGNLIIGERAIFKEQIYRELMRLVLNVVVGVQFRIRIRDIDSPFRVIKRLEMIEINNHKKVELNLFNLENTLIYTKLMGKNLKRVKIGYTRRTNGKSRGIPPSKLIKVIYGALLTLKYYWKYR